jgi:hypothetical protein
MIIRHGKIKAVIPGTKDSKKRTVQKKGLSVKTESP